MHTDRTPLPVTASSIASIFKLEIDAHGDWHSKDRMLISNNEVVTAECRLDSRYEVWILLSRNFAHSLDASLPQLIHVVENGKIKIIQQGATDTASPRINTVQQQLQLFCGRKFDLDPITANSSYRTHLSVAEIQKLHQGLAALPASNPTRQAISVITIARKSEEQ